MISMTSVKVLHSCDFNMAAGWEAMRLAADALCNQKNSKLEAEEIYLYEYI